MGAVATDVASAKATKPLRAFAVTENDERTGGIIFARHSIVARRIGAGEYADGELSYVSCKRAPWADRFAETRIVPAAVMVAHGWHFECHGCGRRIDEELPTAWENEVAHDEPVNGANMRYARWRPAHVVGNQYGAVFCRKSCQRAYGREEAAKKVVAARTISRFERIILRRFPDAEIVGRDGRFDSRADVTRNDLGALVAKEGSVSFSFPGMTIAPASLTMRTEYRSVYDGLRRRTAVSYRKISWECCYGDKAAFEAYAAAARPGACA